MNLEHVAILANLASVCEQQSCLVLAVLSPVERQPQCSRPLSPVGDLFNIQHHVLASLNGLLPVWAASMDHRHKKKANYRPVLN